MPRNPAGGTRSPTMRRSNSPTNSLGSNASSHRSNCVPRKPIRPSSSPTGASRGIGGVNRGRIRSARRSPSGKGRDHSYNDNNDGIENGYGGKHGVFGSDVKTSIGFDNHIAQLHDLRVSNQTLERALVQAHGEIERLKNDIQQRDEVIAQAEELEYDLVNNGNTTHSKKMNTNKAMEQRRKAQAVKRAIGKTQLVRQLKDVISRMRAEAQDKDEIITKMRSSQKATHVQELLVERDEYLTEIQRLQDLVTKQNIESNQMKMKLELEREELNQGDHNSIGGMVSDHEREFFRQQISLLTHNYTKLLTRIEQEREKVQGSFSNNNSPRSGVSSRDGKKVHSSQLSTHTSIAAASSLKSRQNSRKQHQKAVDVYRQEAQAWLDSGGDANASSPSGPPPSSSQGVGGSRLKSSSGGIRSQSSPSPTKRGGQCDSGMEVEDPLYRGPITPVSPHSQNNTGKNGRTQSGDQSRGNALETGTSGDKVHLPTPLLSAASEVDMYSSQAILVEEDKMFFASQASPSVLSIKEELYITPYEGHRGPGGGVEGYGRPVSASGGPKKASKGIDGNHNSSHRTPDSVFPGGMGGEGGIDLSTATEELLYSSKHGGGSYDEKVRLGMYLEDSLVSIGQDISLSNINGNAQMEAEVYVQGGAVEDEMRNTKQLAAFQSGGNGSGLGIEGHHGVNGRERDNGHQQKGVQFNAGKKMMKKKKKRKKRVASTSSGRAAKANAPAVTQPVQPVRKTVANANDNENENGYGIMSGPSKPIRSAIEVVPTRSPRQQPRYRTPKTSPDRGGNSTEENMDEGREAQLNDRVDRYREIMQSTASEIDIRQNDNDNNNDADDDKMRAGRPCR